MFKRQGRVFCVLLLWIAVLSSAWSGCEGDGSHERVAFVYDTCMQDVDEFIDIYAAALCHHWQRCPFPLPIQFFHDQAFCRKFAAYSFANQLPKYYLELFIQSEMTCILKSEVNALVAEMWTGECKPLERQFDSPRVYQGSQPTGEHCLDHRNCRNGYCVPQVLGGCFGICVPYEKPGESCHNDYQCMLGHVCYKNMCVSSHMAEWSSVGASCDWGNQCAYGLYCDSSDYTCRRWLEQGEVCDSPFDFHCRPGLMCNHVLNQCKPILRVVQEGARCGLLDSGDFGACEISLNLVCMDDPDWNAGVCVRLPNEGEPCFFMEGESVGECMFPDLYCDGETGFCAKKKKIRAECLHDHECETNRCTIPANGEIGRCSSPPLTCI